MAKKIIKGTSIDHGFGVKVEQPEGLVKSMIDALTKRPLLPKPSLSGDLLLKRDKKRHKSRFKV